MRTCRRPFERGRERIAPLKAASHAAWLCQFAFLACGPLAPGQVSGAEAKATPDKPTVTLVKSENLRISVTAAPHWSRLFKRTDGWTGGDGIYAIPLSGHEGPGKADKSKTLLVFSDSFIGTVDAGTRARGNFRMVNNTLALLDGPKPADDTIRFLWGKNGEGSPGAVFVPNTPASRGKKCWYWLQDGLVVGRTLYILPMLVSKTPAGGAWGFKTVGVSMLTIPLGPRGPQLRKHTQADTALFHVNAARTLYFGAAIMPNTVQAGAPNPDGYVYVYGRYQTDEIKLAVARVRATDFGNLARWRFWDGRAWSADIARTAPLGRGGPELSVTPVATGPLKGKVLLVSMHLERDLFIRIGQSPVGPFGPRINIYHTTEPDAGQGIYTYNAKAHPHLASPGQWLISYNVNTATLRAHAQNADIYRPRFLTVRFESARKQPRGLPRDD